MSSEYLKQHVQQALKDEWPAFVKTHPHLGGAIDEIFWTSAAIESIAEDPAFVDAMTRASALGLALDRGPAIVRDFVSRWLKKIG